MSGGTRGENMKKIISLFSGFFLFFICTAVHAEPGSGSTSQPEVIVVNYTDVIALQRSALQLRQQKIVLDNLQLTPEESEAFWPVFRAYQNDYEKIGDRIVELIIKFNEKFETMTDEEASAMLQEAQDIQQSENDLKKSYVEKFSKTLSPKKVLRFYQIDNKIRTEIRYNLSLEIPLLEIEEAVNA